MKVLLLCLALLACCQASKAKAKSKTPTGAEIISLLQQDTTVDEVLEALQGWRDYTNEDIESLDANFAVHDPELEALVDAAQGALDEKLRQCAAIDDVVKGGLQQAQDIRDNIKNAQDTIESNNQKAQAAKDARCAQNLLFVSELAGKQEAVGFLQYLRKAVADPAFVDYINSQAGALIQLKNALSTKQENEILSLIAKHHMLSKMQVKAGDSEDEYTGDPNLDEELTASVRDSEEVGTGHVDNTRGELDLEGISDDYEGAEANVQELLGYIDQLIASLQGDAEKAQAAETKSVQAFIEYLQQLKDQNYVLAKYIEAAQANLAAVEEVNANNLAAAEQCRAGVPPLEENVKNAQDAHDGYEEDYNNKRATAVDLLSLLDQAIQVYTEEVVNVASEDEKKRADDFLDNQEFDSTPDFARRREIPNAPSA